MSSSGEMKTSLKLIIWERVQNERADKRGRTTNVLVLYVLEELEFAVGALGEDGGGEGLHDLLDGDRGVGELVVCGADETEGAHAYGLEVDITGRDLEDGAEDGELDKVGHVGKTELGRSKANVRDADRRRIARQCGRIV